jgi:hypothetical protein
MRDACEPVFIKSLVAESPIERLDIPVLVRPPHLGIFSACDRTVRVRYAVPKRTQNQAFLENRICARTLTLLVPQYRYPIVAVEAAWGSLPDSISSSYVPMNRPGADRSARLPLAQLHLTRARCCGPSACIAAA